MSIVVFWLDAVIGEDCNSILKAEHKAFTDAELLSALAFAETLRKMGLAHVTISTELSNSIGKPGVNSVENGKTPDGHDYEWSKKQRGDGPRKD